MKKLILTFGILITLSGCGYDSYDECMLKELQKCGSDNPRCSSKVDNYCDSLDIASNREQTSKLAPEEDWVPEKAGGRLENVEIGTYSENSKNLEIVITNKNPSNIDFIQVFTSPFKCSDAKLDVEAEPYFKSFFIEKSIKKRSTEIIKIDKSKLLSGCRLFLAYGYL